jgi:hypothetical protein
MQKRERQWSGIYCFIGRIKYDKIIYAAEPRI